jgi:hypothetical protein
VTDREDVLTEGHNSYGKKYFANDGFSEVWSAARPRECFNAREPTPRAHKRDASLRPVMRSQMCRRPVISDHANEKSKEIMHGPVDQQAIQVILIKIKSTVLVSPKYSSFG